MFKLPGGSSAQPQQTLATAGGAGEQSGSLGQEACEKPSFNSSPTLCGRPPHLPSWPSCFSGKTRTKDKYRVVYTDHQRLELEKEFHYSRYITIRRKSELAANLGLTERQVRRVPHLSLAAVCRTQ